MTNILLSVCSMFHGTSSLTLSNINEKKLGADFWFESFNHSN